MAKSKSSSTLSLVLQLLAVTAAQCATKETPPQPQQLYQTPNAPTPYNQQQQYQPQYEQQQQYPQQPNQPQNPQYQPQQSPYYPQQQQYQPQPQYQYQQPQQQYQSQQQQYQPQYNPQQQQQGTEVAPYQAQDSRQGRAQAQSERPTWYAAPQPQSGAGCQNGDRSGQGRAINNYDTPQQLPGTEQSQPHQAAGWKDPNQQQSYPQRPSQQQQPPPSYPQDPYNQPPQQEYYNVVVPSQDLPKYIQKPRDQQRPPQNLNRGPQSQQPPPQNVEDQDDEENDKPKPRYPLTPPSLKFKIGLISDLGKDSSKEDKKKYKSFFKIGNLLLQQEGNGNEGNATIEFDDENEEDNHELETGINTSGEGFELSTLNVFNGKLYACDDETGIVYELIFDEETKNYTAHPWVLLPSSEEGFKCEWATVKDNQLWVGSTGVLFPKKVRDNSTEGGDSKDEEEEEIHDDDYDTRSSDTAKEATPIKAQDEPNKDDKKSTTTQKPRPKRQARKEPTDDSDEFDKTRQNIKKITKDGRVIHVDWSKQYEMIAEALGVNQKKGFVVHEAVAWSEVHQKWLFAPRRLSKQKFDKESYFKTGTNFGIWTDDQFGELETVKFGEEAQKTTGFTDIKFIPGTEDKLIIALKAGLDESSNKLVSSLSVYDWEGKEIMKDMPVGEGVYAGVEFL